MTPLEDRLSRPLAAKSTRDLPNRYPSAWSNGRPTFHLFLYARSNSEGRLQILDVNCGFSTGFSAQQQSCPILSLLQWSIARERGVHVSEHHILKYRWAILALRGIRFWKLLEAVLKIRTLRASTNHHPHRLRHGVIVFDSSTRPGEKRDRPLSAAAIPSHSGLKLGFDGVRDGGRPLVAHAAVPAFLVLSRLRHLSLVLATQLAHLKDANDDHPDAHSAYET